MEIIYATTNKGKKNQVQSFLDYNKYNVKLLDLKDIGFDYEIEENGETFEENSLIKAVAVKKFCSDKGINKIIVADDTGLIVDALPGKLGVHTARYAGDHATQDIVLGKLLEEMKDVPEFKRTARFICVLTVFLENGEKLVCRGTTEGKISNKCGTMGKLTFGPIFIPEGKDRVMNDLTEEEIGHTHRQKAWRELLDRIGM